MSDRLRAPVLIVDPQADFRRAAADALDRAGCVAAQSGTYADAMARLDGFAYDALIVDVRLPDGDGLDVLDAALTRYPKMRCVVTASFASIHHAVRALKRGAIEYLIKPIAHEQLTDIIRVALDSRTVDAPIGPRRTAGDFQCESMVGRGPAMAQLMQTLSLVSPMQSTVLIQGETGTGKELVARTIHENSTRQEHPFVAFNAAAVPDGLAEAELFGHVKGAFTGAVYSRVGRFEAADRGTLFVDEVSSMSMALQAKLLRALQEREIERVGESRPIKFDARVVAATNADLKKLVKDGAFREDLYYRLHVIPITLPALRERREDIALLARHFVQKSCKSNNLPPKTLSQEALRVLMAHAWPGNIRQLENAIEHAVAMSGHEREIGAASLPGEIHASSAAMLLPTVAIPDEGINFTSVVSQLERGLIGRCLEKTGGNKRQAARLLQLSRTTLIDKLHRLNIAAGQPAA